jgi:hypothetical protein
MHSRVGRECRPPKRKEWPVNDEEPALEEDDAPEDSSEAAEVEGVATEIGAAQLAPEDAERLDQNTLDTLDDEGRTALEEAAAEAGPATRGAGHTRLSPNFVLAEFHCCRGHCAAASVPGDAIPALRRLVREVLQPMRDQFGRCDVHSGYRNAAHNGHVGGVTGSRHRYDVTPAEPAADVSFASGSVDEWARAARHRLRHQVGDVGGIGRYHSSGFVHIDLGPKRKWTG